MPKIDQQTLDILSRFGPPVWWVTVNAREYKVRTYFWFNVR